MTYTRRPTTEQKKVAAVLIGDRVEVAPGVVGTITAIEDRHGVRVLVVLGRRWKFNPYALITSHFCAGIQ